MVLLLDKSPGGKTTTTNVWLQRRGYQVKQVECLTDVIENTIDFTLGVQPSLILLNCGQGDDVCEDRLRLLQEITESKNLPIIALAGLTESFIGDKILTIENLEALQPLLNNLLTKSYSKAA
jgi:DNA-binding response OmpR family regulator